MINLPHIGLYGDLSACEDGMIDALNRNFSLLDAIVQLKVLGFVTDLPEDPEKGDVYILNTPLDPSTDKDLMIFNGTNWVQIIPQDGFIAYIDSEEAFYYYNDGEWIKDLTDLSEIKLKLGRATSTGVIDGLNLSITVGDDTKFEIAAGIYEIVDLSDVNNPVVKTIEYAGSTGNTVTNLATQDVTYISLDEDGVIHQSINYTTPNERRQYAFIGRLNHTNRTSISFADTFPDFKLSPVSSLYDLMDALAPFKMDHGLKTTPNGANLSFDVSAGKVFFRSDNYTTDKNNPHTKTFNDQVLAPFRKMTQTSTVDAADVTVLEPSYYDVAGVRTLIAGGPNQATIQRIYKYKSGAIRVAYGQNIYTNINAAREAVNFDSFIENPTINQTAVLIALVIVTKGCTDLSDPSQCVILPTSRFGSVSGGGGGGTGSGVMVVSDLTARNNIPEGTRTNGMLVQVISEDTIYKLIGLPSGATTTDANWDPVITGKAVQVITNKDIDGGTASNTSRSTIPRAATIEAADALVRKKATLLYNDFTNKFLKDNGTDLKSIPDFGDVNIFAQEIAADNVIGSWTQNLSGITATFAKGTDSRLGTCYKLDITSASSGAGGTYTVRKDFTVPEAFRGTFVELSYDYVSTVSKTGTCVMVYDVTNSTEIVPQTDIQAQPDPTSLVTKGFITFSIPSTCDTLRVFIGRALDPSAIAISNQYFYFNNLQFKKYTQAIAITEGPKSHIRFNNGNARGSTNTSVHYFTDLAEQSGTGLTYVNTAALGTEIIVLKSGVLIASVQGNRPASASAMCLTKNNTTNSGTTSATVLGAAAMTSAGGFSQTLSASTRVVAGDIIRVTSTTNMSSAQVYNSFSVTLHEDNLAARYADYTLNQDVSFVGFRAASTASSTTVNVKVDSVKDTVGAWNAVNGEYEVKSAGDYTAILAGKVSSGSSAVVYKNGVSTGYQIGTTGSATYTLNGTAIIPNCIVGDKLSIRTTASINLTDTYLSFSKRATSQQLFAPIAQRYVVKTYESGASWWEVYSDGWLRQGSHSQAIVANGTTNISYLILMKDATNHSIYMTNTEGQNVSSTSGVQKVSSKTTSGFSYATSGVNLSHVSPTSWVVEGYGDSAEVRARGANPSY